MKLQSLRYLLFALCISGSIAINASDDEIYLKKLCEEYQKEYNAIYARIKDLKNPSAKELKYIQNYLKHGKREYLDWIDTYYPDCRNDGYRIDRRMRNVKIYASGMKIQLSATPFVIGTTSKNKERCVICYSSYNLNFVTKIKRFPKLLAAANYQGHFLQQIGIWPDVKGGSLKLAHVPYAFKVSMLNEARRLGYKHVLWLDSSFVPQNNLDEIFGQIEKDGYFVTTLPYTLHSHGSEMMRISFGLTDKEMRSNHQCAGGLVGINFDHPDRIKLFKAWYKAAEDLGPFLSPRSDQVALGALIYKLNLPDSGKASYYYAGSKSSLRDHHSLLLQY